jgi:hypothetical protein
LRHDEISINLNRPNNGHYVPKVRIALRPNRKEQE